MIKLYVAGTRPVGASQLKFENAAEELQQSLEMGILPVHLIDVFTGQEVGTSCIKVYQRDEPHWDKYDEEYCYTGDVFASSMQDLSTGETIDLKTVNTDKILNSYYSRICNTSDDTPNLDFDKLFKGWQLSDRVIYCDFDCGTYDCGTCSPGVLNIDKGEIVIKRPSNCNLEYCTIVSVFGAGEWGFTGKRFDWVKNWDGRFIKGVIDTAALAGLPIYEVYDIPPYITPIMVNKIRNEGVCLGGDRALLKYSNVTTLRSTPPPPPVGDPPGIDTPVVTNLFG